MIRRNTIFGGGLALAATLALTGATLGGDGFPSCGDPEAGSCLEDNGTPGCADLLCCESVCDFDAFCCDTAWDSTCVDLALTLCGGDSGCGDPASGGCDVPNGSPGCDDLDCCNAVCEIDPYCCDTTWDSICVSETAVACFDGEPPANDTCFTATDLGTGDQVVPFSSLGASTDGTELPVECESFGEIVIRGDIWYTWTASLSEIAVFSTCNDADFDTRLALWSGDCDNLVFEACNDDGLGCAGFTSEMVASVEAGKTYFIQLGGFNPPSQGTGNLSICEGDDCLAGCISECSKEDVVELEGCGDDTNGGCNGVGYPSQAIAVGDTVCGTIWAAGGSRDTDWFDFSIDATSNVTATARANVSTVLLFVSKECPEPSLVIGEAVDCDGSVTACLPAGDYYVFVGLNGFDGVPCGSGPLNIYQMTLTAEVADDIAGDVCSDAIDLGTFEGDVAVDTACTGTDGEDLPFECDSFDSVTIFNDLFYRWVVPADGDWSVSTCNQASFDTRLAAFDGCGGALIACNDDGDLCANYSSNMLLPGLTTGEEIIIQLGSWDGSQGTATMTISEGGGGPEPPSNDECGSATPVVDGAVVVNTLGSTSSGPTLPVECADFGNDQIFNDVWFVYDSTCDGTALMSMCTAGDTTFDTRIAIYEGDCNGPLIACNDDTCGLVSEVSFPAVCGTTYFVRVGAYSETGFGTGTLDISCTGTGCDGGGCTADFNGDGEVDGADYGFLLVAWGECGGCPEDLNGDGVVGGADVGDLLVQWGLCSP
ncbi:MAG: hypothetical protein GY895_10085 [Phycisphaera sp.]|nr:hypothetical protein [Phycisphaera sp.]